MKYKAFISYSHAVDSPLAAALQTALRLAAKPWYKLQVFDIFRDITDLSVSPHLWEDIESALDDSEHFILLASPPAAKSKWVKREIEHWLERRSLQTLILTVTQGHWRWDDKCGDFDWSRTDAIPQVLTGKFPGEPWIVDLRQITASDDLSLDNDDFLDAIKPILSTLHDKSVKEMFGEIHARHRANLRLRNLVITVLGSLLVLAAGLGLFADSQRQRARSERDAAVLAAENEKIARDAETLAREQAEEERRRAEDAADAERTAREGEEKARQESERERDNARAAAASERQARAAESEARQRAEDALVAEQVARRHELVNSLSARAELHRESDPNRSFRLAAEAYRTDPEIPAGHAALLRAYHHTGAFYQKLYEHSSRIQSLVFSPDGRRLLSTGRDGLAKLYTLATGALTDFRHEGVVEWGAFSPDGSHVATSSQDATVRVWRPDGTLVATFQSNEGTECVGFLSADSVFVGTGARLLRWNWQQDEVLWETAELELGLLECSMSVTGDRIAASVLIGLDSPLLPFERGGTSRLRIFDAVTGEERHRVDVENAAVSHAFTGSDGKTLAIATWGGEIHFWEPPSESVRTVRTLHGAVTTVVSGDTHTVEPTSSGSIGWTSYSSTLLAGFSDGDLRILRTDGTESGSYSADLRVDVSAAALSPTNDFVAAAGDGQVYLWSRHLDRTDVVPLGGRIPAVEWLQLPDGRMLAQFADNRIALVDPSGEDVELQRANVEGEGGYNPMGAVRNARGTRVLFSRRRRGLTVYAAASGESTTHPAQGSAAGALLDDGRSVTFDRGAGKITWWSATGEPERELAAEANVESLHSSLDGSRWLYLSRSDHLAQDLEMAWFEGGEERGRRQLEGQRSQAIIAPDGSAFLLLPGDQTLRLVDFDGRQRWEFSDPRFTPAHASFSPSGRHLVAAHGRDVRLIDTGGDELVKLTAGIDSVGGVGFTDDERFIFAVDDVYNYVFLIPIAPDVLTARVEDEMRVAPDPAES